ncbi:hypothetical protein JCM19232_4124 [Vibrio ishigakensis]|uniref:Uncharacterized protein n=1 Tax=Vibrio ishigakensis TaxID=1481914 RepID=A0A0B8P994_9VIBR|nr:hypothetical protein JCM19232_4124 [Vibrio ishigakensis]
MACSIVVLIHEFECIVSLNMSKTHNANMNFAHVDAEEFSL